MAARNYSNTGSDAEVAVLVGSSDTSAALANYSGFPAHPFIAAIDPDTNDEEIVLVTDVSGATVTMTRAYDGTTAKTHAAGAVFRHVASAKDFQEANTHVNASGAVHGVAGTLVGTTDTQTLSNKTLTAPAITNPTVTGTLSGATGSFSGSVSAGSLTATGDVAVGDDLTVTGDATAATVTATTTVTAADLVATDDLTVGDDATISGDLAVTGTTTLTGTATAGTLNATTVDATTVIPDELELVQTAANLTAATGRSSLWAKTDFGLWWAPNGQSQRRVAMHWGSGTTLPTTGAISGDTYYHTGLSSLLRYNGSNWRQIDGPVDIANMAARPTHADLHAGFQVFSLVDDDMYFYDGTYWRNGLAALIVPTGASAGDYITGVVRSSVVTASGTGDAVCPVGRTFSAAIDFCLASPGAIASGLGITIPDSAEHTTSAVHIECRTTAGANVAGQVRINWHVVGYND